MGILRITGQAVSEGVTNGDPKKAKDALDKAAKARKAARSARSSAATMTVNGKTYAGGKVELQGDGVYVDGKKVD